ncbi:HD domain-containing phosphohydrolase [Alkalibacter saccharofermentans]|uniref:PAS domain S-box-containing protein/diguanylate cyclase (GGDEF) domain-containing protein/HDIG domain-containing protein n=1 Tax=Alkalibacter saccharofermentans DSM 14828 TaxID=1120975 RepID=A0A1M4UW85_9FIRM|nr:HD domain-containing phosphohydrolase [Alkalibacter saccharofermentans]SHE60907.1 PAS domain S-box-containing protein/diguanylate cyclase (GGDEF) domain-containing protein/HDIG domain-containing protein [Alkalibacter saccharofermentans DSM 14828]
MGKKLSDLVNQKLSRLFIGFSKLFLGASRNKPNQEEKKDLGYYKNEAFHKLAILFITIGLFPICYGAYMFFRKNNIIAGVLELLSYLVVLILLLSSRINIMKKRCVFVLSIFLLGLMLLFIAGPMGAGLVVIFSTFGLAAFLLNKRQSIIFIYISLLAFIVISVFLYIGLLDNLAIYQYRDSWYIVAISTQCMGTLFVLIINNLFNNIENLIEEIEKSVKTTAESERSKSVLISNLPGMAYRCNYTRDWTMQFVSDGCIKLTGYPPESLIENRDISFNSLMTPECRGPLWREWERILAKRLPFEYEYEITTASGERKWVLELGEGVYDIHGEVEALEGIILDISDRKKSQEETKRLLERTHSMINNHDAVMLLVEPETGEIIEANPSASSFYGYSKEELLKMTVRDINAMDQEKAAEMRLKALNGGQKYSAVPHHLKSGEIKTVDAYISPIDYDDQRVLFAIIFDVTEREIIAKKNEFLANHDYLTGLYNRRFFDEEFERRVIRGDVPIALLLGNIDGFKNFNDAFGRSKGDEVLKEMANRLAALIFDGGVLARVGGDEFAILVSGKNEDEIRRCLDTLTREFDKDLGDSRKDELLTISWGYGIQMNEDDTLDDLHRQAEAFMNNRKFYNTNSLRSKTVNVIMETLFMKSEREKKHSERVGKLCETIARKMSLSKPEVDKIRVAGLLHDIGKIGIEESILNKVGKLDAKEWEMMKFHPAKGASILAKTIEYNDIAEIVLSHHERYDGKGYPNGLTGTEIPIMARIVAISDAYDAMTELRTYRTPFSKEEAIAELKRCSGTQFDPEIVLVFINVVMGMEKTD